MNMRHILLTDHPPSCRLVLPSPVVYTELYTKYILVICPAVGNNIVLCPVDVLSVVVFGHALT
jgi:hypothetical protein